MVSSDNSPRRAGSLTCPYEVGRPKPHQYYRPTTSLYSSSYSQGELVLQSSRFNKGTAFSEEERTAFKLHGLLPPNHQTLDEQVKRAYQQYSSRQDDLAKNTFMASMKAQNEVLYYRVCGLSHCRYLTREACINMISASTRTSQGDV